MHGSCHIGWPKKCNIILEHSVQQTHFKHKEKQFMQQITVKLLSCINGSVHTHIQENFIYHREAIGRAKSGR